MLKVACISSEHFYDHFHLDMPLSKIIVGVFGKENVMV